MSLDTPTILGIGYLSCFIMGILMYLLGSLYDGDFSFGDKTNPCPMKSLGITLIYVLLLMAVLAIIFLILCGVFLE